VGIYKKGARSFVGITKRQILELRIFSKSVYKILVAFAQRCVYNKSVGLYTRVCI